MLDVSISPGNVVYVRVYNVPKPEFAGTPPLSREIGIRNTNGQIISHTVTQVRNPETYCFDSLQTEIQKPAISRQPTSLSNECGEGENAPTQTFEVWNSNGATLSYAIADNATWLSCDPTSGTSTDEHDIITVTYTTSVLAPGTYSATITITDPNAINTPVTTPVSLTIRDTTPPEITLLGDNPKTLLVGTPYVDPGCTASDNYDGDITGSVVVTGSVNYNVLGSYVLCYNVSDSSGNPAEQKMRTVNVVDTTAPEITLLGDNPLTLSVGTLYVDPGYTASDNYDGDITGSVAVTGLVDHTTLGAYVLYYNVSDSSGNPAEEKTRTVNVVKPDAVVTIGPPSSDFPGPGFQVEVPVTVDLTEDLCLGVYTFEVIYDPLIVVIASIAGGTTPEFSAAPMTNPASFDTGITRFDAINTTSVTSPTGLVSVAVITFEAVGEPGDSSNINLGVVTLRDTETVSLSYRVVNTSVSIQDYWPGDVNGDGVVDSGDAMLIRQVEVLLRDREDPIFSAAGFDNGDINEDGICDSGDAMLIRQAEVGLRPLYPGMPGYGEAAMKAMAGAAALMQGAAMSIASSSEDPYPGDKVTVSLDIDVAEIPLGAYTIEVKFDSAVVAVDSVEGGTTPEFSVAPLTNPEQFTGGSFRLNGVNETSLTSPTGVVNVAKITFDVIGTPGDSTEITTTVVTVKDTSANAILVGAVAGKPVRVFEDSDGDALPDGWEADKLGGMSEQAEDDYDQDGFSNYGEYIAGTNPHDRGSVFLSCMPVVKGDECTLTWASVPGKVYRLWYSNDMLTWSLMTGPVPAAQGETTSWSGRVAPEHSKGYYRMEVLR
jgi:hypothetical protein